MVKVKGIRKSNFNPSRSPVLTRSSLVNYPQILRQMANSNTNDQTVRHEIYTTNVRIPLFSGLPEDVNLDSYITYIDTHIRTKKITSDAEKIDVFKYFLHRDRGEARNVIGIHPLKDGNLNYKDYVIRFKRFFVRDSENEPLRAFVTQLDTKRHDNESLIAFVLFACFF